MLESHKKHFTKCFTFVSLKDTFTKKTNNNMPTLTAELAPNARQDGNHAIRIRVTENRKHKRVNIGYYIKEADWNKDAKQNKHVRTTHPNHLKINQEIVNAIRKIEAKIGEPEEAITQMQAVTISDYCIVIAKRFTSQKRYGTACIYESLAKAVIEFGAEQTTLRDMNLRFIVDFQEFLLVGNDKRNPMKQNSVTGYLHKLSTLWNYAYTEEPPIVDGDRPFAKFKYRKEQVYKERLSLEEITAIEALALEVNSPQWHTRNIFLFQYYVFGIRIGNAINLKWDAIQGDYIRMTLLKKGGPKLFPLCAQAKEILARYQFKLGEYIFPFLDRRYMDKDNVAAFADLKDQTNRINHLLGRLVKKVGITRHISSHVARHSLANNAKQAGVDMGTLSQLLGHSTIAMTQNYVASFDGVMVSAAGEKIYGKPGQA